MLVFLPHLGHKLLEEIALDAGLTQICSRLIPTSCREERQVWEGQ